jgi:hypothetical protein
MSALVLLILILKVLITDGGNSVHQNKGSVSQESDRVHSECSQPAAELDALIREAVAKQFLVGRVEFIGNAHTRDNVLRRKILLDEGDVFTRENLVKSLESVSKLRKIIYPVKLNDVEIRLHRSDKIIDIGICFQEKQKSPGQRSVPASPPAKRLQLTARQHSSQVVRLSST